MHYSVVCIIPKHGEPEQEVAKLLNPLEGEMLDFWQVGGRWTGFFDPQYDPERDPQNIAPCDLCRGTGQRNDRIGRAARKENPRYGCNGCDGKGKRVVWPTKWAPFAGDIQPVMAVLAGKELRLPYATVVDGDWHELHDTPDGATQYRNLLVAHRNERAVIVDVHN